MYFIILFFVSLVWNQYGEHESRNYYYYFWAKLTIVSKLFREKVCGPKKGRLLYFEASV